MPKTKQIAREIAVIMPVIARRVLLKFFQSVNLTQTQLFTIMTLYEKAPIRLNELSTKLNISAPTVTGIVDRLEKSGYAKRLPDKEDRRAIKVDLTSKGMNIAKKLRTTIEGQWEEILNKLSQKDRELYLEILSKIQRSL